LPAPTMSIVAMLAMGAIVGASTTEHASAGFTAREQSQGNSWAYAAAKAATHIAFSQSPSDSTGGLAFSRQPVVVLLDVAGVPATGTRTITLSLAGGTAGALHCTANPVATAQGIARFARCSVDKVGKYTLVASATSLPSISSASFTISAGPAAQLAFTATPTTTALGAPFATQPAVRVLDAVGNPTTSTTSVTLGLTSSPAGATLSCAQNPKAAVAGIASFTGCSVNKAGTYTITAHATSLIDATSPPFAITAAPALTCNSTVWMATFSWTPTPHVPTTYALYVNGIKVQAAGADGWNSYVQLTSNNVPVSQFPAGTATVEVRKVLSGGAEQVVGTGTVALGTAGYRTYLCG